MLPRQWIAIGLSTLLMACEQEGIRAYRAPKPPPPPTTAGSQPNTGPQVTWTAPSGWEAVKTDQPMRLATFKPASGQPEITIAAFPGDTGGLLANINRWRGQLGLDPIEEAELPKAVETSTVDTVKVTLTELAGKNGQNMLGALIDPGDGQTWFVKAVGEPAAVAALKPEFDAFARSFRFSAAPPPTTPNPLLPAPVANDDVQARLTTFSLPADWKPDPNASPIVAAAYDATNPDGVAKITATMLLNDGGGALANINRWRDQLGLPPVTSLEVQPITDLGRGNLIVDLTSADNSKRMISSIVASHEQTWFFKMTGPPKAVESERAAYERFVRTVGLGERTP